LLAAVFLSTCPTAFSAALSLVNQTADPGQTVAEPILFAAAGQPIAAVQFDLQWDPALAVQIAPGATPGQSYKILYTASPVPGARRCLIVGFNQNPLADGPVLQLFITVGSSASPGVAQVTLTNALATSPAGEAVPLQSVTSVIQIQSGSTAPLALTADSVLNAASLLSGPVAPGEIITLLGSIPASPSVLFNSVPAPMIYSGNGQVNAVAPFGLNLSGPADVQIRGQNQTTAEGSISVTSLSPAIFTQTGTGSGPGAVLNEDFSLNSFSNPAAANSILMVYGTGFGFMQSPLGDGQIVSGPLSLALPVSATIGGVPATVLYAGAAPTLIAGLTQINIQVPQGLPTNPFTPIVLSVGTSTTQAGVTVSIR